MPKYDINIKAEELFRIGWPRECFTESKNLSLIFNFKSLTLDGHWD
jgi:hypothetical protein